VSHYRQAPRSHQDRGAVIACRSRVPQLVGGDRASRAARAGG